MRARITTALLALLAALGLATTAVPAAAHDQLLSSVPADGETLTAAPAELGLTFNAELAAIGSAVLVAAPDGTDVSAGEPVTAGTQVTVPLAGGLVAGTYQVTWRVTSSDGHPIEGTFSFTLDLPAEPTTAEPTETAAVASPVAESATPQPSTQSSSSEASDEPTEDATTSPAGMPGPAGGLPSWLMGVIAAGSVATIVLLLVRLRQSSRLRD